MTTRDALFSFAGAIAALLFAAVLFAAMYAANWPRPQCPFEGNECPNAQKAMRNYQFELYNDSTVIYDGDRRVGMLPFDSTQGLDKLMTEDNQ